MILGLVLLTSILFPIVANADGGLKISSLSEVEEKAKEGSDTIVNIGKYILGAVLIVTLVYVIYAVSSNQPHAKEMAFGWIIAVIIIPKNNAPLTFLATNIPVITIPIIAKSPVPEVIFPKDTIVPPSAG